MAREHRKTVSIMNITMSTDLILRIRQCSLPFLVKASNCAHEYKIRHS